MEIPESIDIYGAFLGGKNIYNLELKQKGIIVMGNESKGISDEVASFINSKIHIPPYQLENSQNAESLNVSVATAIIFSEFRRIKS